MIQSQKVRPSPLPARQEAVHYRQLYLPRTSAVHRLNPAVKILTTFLFVVAVSLLPRYQFAAVLVDLLILVMVIVMAKLPIRTVMARLSIAIPFVSFSFLIPFIASGPTTSVLWLDLSTEGLWAAWGILSKALLGTGASIVLSSTTSIPDLLKGLSRLRVPSVVVSIMAFMFRYLDLVFGQIHRIRNAMIARAHDPRWLWQAKPIAVSAGAVFVRTYERGERAHLAMLSRGYNGSMPDLTANQDRRQSLQYTHTVLGLAPAGLAWLNLIVLTEPWSRL